MALMLVRPGWLTAARELSALSELDFRADHVSTRLCQTGLAPYRVIPATTRKPKGTAVTPNDHPTRRPQRRESRSYGTRKP